MHDRPRHPLPRRRTGLAAGPLVVLVSSSLLSGCAAPPPEPVPSPVPSLTQEQQDDAAFRDVMTRYVDLDANTDTEEDLAAILTGNLLEDEKSGLATQRQAGQRTVGKEVATGFVVTDRGLDPDGVQYMTAQVCLDLTGTRLLDREGSDITPDTDQRLSLQAKAVVSAGNSWRISDVVRNEDVHACG